MLMTARYRVRAVLFDLDGTLADTAPDLGGAVNRLRARRDLPPLPIATLRPVASSGARGMLGVGFGMKPGEPGYDALRDEFLAEYEAALDVDSRLFEGVADCLAALHSRGLRWGIVTNKASRFTAPVVAGLGLAAKAAVVIAGDTTPHAKPHPAPLIEAARRIGVEPRDCAYVGDDLRDVLAGRAAGMTTVAVRWGYLGLGDPIEAWGADHIADSPADVLKHLAMA